jgi:hypothetical protein
MYNYGTIDLETGQLIGMMSTTKEIPESIYNKPISQEQLNMPLLPHEEGLFYENEKWVIKNIFNPDSYKKRLLDMLSERNYKESEKILPISKQINILTGNTQGYPDYLTGKLGIENVGKFLSIYKTIYNKFKKDINSLKTKKEIDEVYDKIIFPTLDEILIKIKKKA